tara:strand:+ start:551 stop:835 length:285 start_codon:yes stop_codon:yes gene_type:complete
MIDMVIPKNAIITRSNEDYFICDDCDLQSQCLYKKEDICDAHKIGKVYKLFQGERFNLKDVADDSLYHSDIDLVQDQDGKYVLYDDVKKMIKGL